MTKLVNIEGLGFSAKYQAKHDSSDVLDRFHTWTDEVRKVETWGPRPYADLAALAQRLREADERLIPELADHLAREGSRPLPDGRVTLKYDPMLVVFPPIDLSMASQYELWDRVTCPVQLVYGQDSWASNPAKDGRMAHFRDARLAMFDDAGHWVHHDRREDFIALVRDFLA